MFLSLTLFKLSVPHQHLEYSWCEKAVPAPMTATTTITHPLTHSHTHTHTHTHNVYKFKADVPLLQLSEAFSVW